jgi:hypothetical protein
MEPAGGREVGPEGLVGGGCELGRGVALVCGDDGGAGAWVGGDGGGGPEDGGDVEDGVGGFRIGDDAEGARFFEAVGELTIDG